MTFPNFSQLLESVFRPNYKPNFTLTGKCFPLTNFSNGKKIHKSLESDFPETIFQKTNTAKRENTFLKTKLIFFFTEKCFSLTGKCFSLTGKCFLLIIFFNDK
jgi:hypothetical protein